MRFLGDRKQDGKTGKENVVQGTSGGFAQAEKNLNQRQMSFTARESVRNMESVILGSLLWGQRFHLHEAVSE